MSQTPDRPAPGQVPGQVYVWDRFVRSFHWTLVVAFAIAFLTEDEVMILHVWAGYLVGALLALRVVWGVVGPRHARFTDFVCRPSAVRAYLASMLAFRPKRYLGHNPAGGAMVIALLLVLAATVATGIAADDPGSSRSAAGELRITALLAPALALADSDGDDRDQGERDGGFIGEVHEVLANLSLVLVIVHVAGVALACLVHRENLVRAMITGWKRA